MRFRTTTSPFRRRIPIAWRPRRGCSGSQPPPIATSPRARARMRQRRQPDPDGVQPPGRRVRRHRSVAPAGRRGARDDHVRWGCATSASGTPRSWTSTRAGAIRLHHLPRRVLVGRAARAGRDPADRRTTISSQNGVAYISYNTYPGWHMREMVRHMMRYHAGRFDEPTEQIEQARALLDFLASAVGQHRTVRPAAESRRSSG